MQAENAHLLTVVMTTLTLLEPYKKILLEKSFLPTAQAHTHLCDEELGEPLRQSALLTGEDHLQHVTMQLLHHYKHFLWSLKHAL